MSAAGPQAIVIGAGAAGLACAADLQRAGLTMVCLEARDRIGGRMHTLRDARTALPIEIGAEFVHGRPQEIFDLAEASGLSIVETGGRMLHLFDGHIAEGGEDGPVLEDVKRTAAPEHDETFQAFLQRSHYSEEERVEAGGFVEGFNAARKEEISVASLAKDMRAAHAIEGDRAFRLTTGYGALASVLAEGLDIQLDSVVQSIAWRPGNCRVRLATGLEYSAPRVVITVPLGVLQAAAIAFDPEPPGISEAVGALRFGQAVRVTFRFDRAFWEDDPRFRDTGFLISDQPLFPVWWSALPAREPLLTGWSAGPKADPLLGLQEDEITARALASLRRIVGREPANVLGAWTHDWHADPFARGAYSWVPAGALPARDTLARPVAGTLFFAGEHTDLSGYGGTVHGAIATGRRAARQILSGLP